MNSSLASFSPEDRYQFLRLLSGDQLSLILPQLSPLCSTLLLPSDIQKSDCSSTNDYFSEILIALFVFDECIENLSGYPGHVYVLGDDSLNDILKEEPVPASTIPERSAMLETLAVIGLIYRFNVALKFGYPTTGIMQLRLNAWGRQCIEAFGLRRVQQYQRIRSYCSQLVLDYACEYREILLLCGTHNRPLDLLRIHQINATLPIRVVT